LIIEDGNQLTLPNAKEQLIKNQMNFPHNVRLACQTKVAGGPVKLRKTIQDETKIGLYVGNAANSSTQYLGEESEWDQLLPKLWLPGSQNIVRK
jgi:adenylate cyclase